MKFVNVGQLAFFFFSFLKMKVTLFLDAGIGYEVW